MFILRFWYNLLNCSCLIEIMIAINREPNSCDPTIATLSIHEAYIKLEYIHIHNCVPA